MTRVVSFDEALEILESPRFVGGQTETESFPFRGQTVIEVRGEDHLARRRSHAPLFARTALMRYETDVLDPAIDQAMRELDDRRGADGLMRADLIALTRQILMHVIAAVIGLDGIGSPGRATMLQSYWRDLNDGVNVKWLGEDHSDVINRALRAKEGFVKVFFGPALARRKRLINEVQAGRLERGSLHPDLITLSLLNSSPAEDEDRFAREAILYVIAGVGTSVGTIAAVVEELDGWLVGHPEDRVKLLDTKFLKKAIHETLRFRPTFPGMVRQATEDAVLKSGRSVRAGEYVAIDNQAVNRDPAIFGDDADQFNPYRSVPYGVRPYGLAFGAGPRVCIGRPMVTATSDTGSDIERTLVHVLKVLYQHGITLDPDRAPVLAPGGLDSGYEVLPVRFDASPPP